MASSDHHHSGSHHHSQHYPENVGLSSDSSEILSADNGGHATSNSHDMMMNMKSYFHIGFGDTILFKDWILESASDVVIACLIFFILAIIYEGLKSFRDSLFRREARSGAYRISVLNPTNGCPDDVTDSSASAGLGLSQSRSPDTAVINCSMWSQAHLYQSILHSIQVMISYTLMLGFMSFNTWICLSIITGAGIGYFLFCWRKLTIVNVTDHCN